MKNDSVDKKITRRNIKMALRINRIASRLGIPFIMIGSGSLLLRSGIRRVSDIDIVVRNATDARRLLAAHEFQTEVNKGAFRFDVNRREELGSQGVFNGKISETWVDVFSQHVGGIPVETIFSHSTPFQVGHHPMRIPTIEMYACMKLVIQKFDESSFKGNISKGSGRGNAPAKKDLRDIMAVWERVDPKRLEEIVRGLSSEKQQLIKSNMDFLASKRTEVTLARTIMQKRLAQVRKGRSFREVIEPRMVRKAKQRPL